MNDDSAAIEHQKEDIRRYIERLGDTRLLIREESTHCRLILENVWVSVCFHCGQVVVWIRDRLIWPKRGDVPLANPDLPDEIRADYDEASTILDLSPRGSVALLRLCIQKLCKHLGEKGENINNDIGNLVKKGLDFRVQQALDIVRVIGNNAVHPGQMDLRDDRATAESLFGLVNLIADNMISLPKRLSEMYESLPPSALKAIEKRDGS